jgi:biopolymer transport protein ExbB/TolQ
VPPRPPGRRACDILPPMTDAVASPGSAAAAGDGSQIGCPHCGQPNRRPGEQPDAILDCSRCSRSYVTPRSPDLDSSRALSTALPESVQARCPTDVGLRRTGLAAAALTLLFYVAVVKPLSDTYFGELFGARGWVPYVIAWLSAWAGLLLAGKALLLARQRKSLTLDLLPDALSSRVTAGNAASFRRHLQHLAERELPPRRFPASRARNLLVERLDRALEHFRMRGSASDVVDQLGNQSQIDANAVESSYTMIRVFIWAIPLLGFIGTVLGISEAVAGFSDSVAQAVDLDVMKQSIGAVTSGLGVAFDTTLLALVMSIFIMFPTSSLQKAEEDFLDRVDVYCEQHLGRRLDDSGTEAGAPPDALPGLVHLTDGASEGLAKLEAHLSRLADAVGALDERLDKTGRGRGDGKG